MTRSDFGRRLKHVRESKGLSQEELAVLIGLKDRSSISKIEKGERGMDYICLSRLISALGVSPLVFFDADQSTVLTGHEQEVIIEYRNHPEFQPAIDAMLGIEKKEENGNCIKTVD